MSNYVTFSTITTLSPPFSGTACDFYGNNCHYIGSGFTTPITFTLPTQFNTASILQITLTDSSGCTVSEIVYCTP